MESNRITISTTAGAITGLQKDGHLAFLGIRYAKAPVGVLRFKPPERLDAWEGQYDATQYAPMAPQAYPDNPVIHLAESEDCLSLNITTPGADGKQRPVMVYIHGGGFLIDSGSRPRTYGGNLAEAGDVVVVTIEYRMGAFGFLHCEGISPNLGLQDQVCALGWVQRHIAGFGGDPGNVTIFGESAGATSVAYLLVMPSAQGLFHKAILESGAFPFESPADNRRFAANGMRKFFKQLGLQPGDLAGLQQAPYEAILQAEKKAAGQLLFSDRAFYPVIDGKIVPEDVYGALRSGHAAQVPVIVGHNAEELPLFGAFIKSPVQAFLVKQILLRNIRRAGVKGRPLAALLALYRRTFGPGRDMNHLLSDMNFRIPEILLAEARLPGGPATYFYCFAHPAPKAGAAVHVMELYFVFGTLDTPDVAEMMQVPGTEAERRLSQAMMAAWTAFARSGNPNHPGLPGWPAYDAGRRATMFFELSSHVVEAPSDEIRARWMEVAPNRSA